MKKKGFMLGVAIGAAAAVAYEMGERAKKCMSNGKKMVKDKIDNILE